MSAQTENFPIEVIKDFTKGLAGGAGTAIGGQIMKSIFGALGKGGDNEEELNNKLTEISTELKTIEGQLNDIINELKNIEDNQHKQIIQAALEQWSNHNYQDKINRIYGFWEDAEDGSTTPEQWKSYILGTKTTEPIINEVYQIESALKSPDTSPLEAYANLIALQIEYEFPWQQPWLPAQRLYNYCAYLLQHFWYATTMAKTANRMAHHEDIAKGCVEGYLKAVQVVESQAFEQMARILGMVNMQIAQRASTSFPVLYDPFFSVEDFHFQDIFDPTSKQPEWQDFAPSGDKVNKSDLFKSNMGKDIENLDQLLSAYRPTAKAYQEGGRINIYLSYWLTFYEKHADSQKLNDVQLSTKDGDKTTLIPASESGFVDVELHINSHYYVDKKLDASAIVEPFYNTGDTQIRFYRFVYFVPYGHYTVDEGSRAQWHYQKGDYSFMGNSHYEKQETVLDKDHISAMLRWSPWDGAYIMANDKAS
ncbi:MAG: hypothetical protein JNM22_18405 [Saprospiraceae bacterium]|nr:hypothetical protein [Saprospiraceae bacterium]